MTYEDLQIETKALKKEQDRSWMKYQLKISDAELRYINEHQPIALKKYQKISVRVRVTEETRKNLIESYRAKKKYQLGNEYTVTGFFIGWTIGDDGSVRPCLYGGASYYRQDEIVSVTLTKDQPCGDCRKCRCHKDGLCYMQGGQEMGKRFATHKIQDGDIPCPKYEEVLEGGLYEYGERHCPNVTKRWKNGKLFYHVYSLNWNYYTEYSEDEVWRFYTKEPKKEAI